LTDVVVVFRAHGFRFVIYTADHEPAHVHVIGDGLAKVNLVGPDGQPELVLNVGIKRSDLRRIMTEVADRRMLLLYEWERIHGPAE
jgi:hypothetical protein